LLKPAPTRRRRRKPQSGAAGDEAKPGPGDARRREADGVPNVAEADLAAVVSGDILPDSAPPDADVSGETGDAPDDEDDNPCQHSHEALPDDVQEAVIRRNSSREGGLFDEAPGRVRLA